MTDLEQQISIVANGMIDRWAREAQAAGLDTELFICDKLDELEVTEPEVSMAVGQAWLVRRFAR